MSPLGTLVIIGIGYASACGMLVAPAYFWEPSPRLAYRKWEASAFALPAAVWVGLNVAFSRPKSISNMGEVFAAAIIVGALSWLRVYLPGTKSGTHIAVAIQGVPVILIVLLYFVVPILPE
jgi:hypothetical protein